MKPNNKIPINNGLLRSDRDRHKVFQLEPEIARQKVDCFLRADILQNLVGPTTLSATAVARHHIIIALSYHSRDNRYCMLAGLGFYKGREMILIDGSDRVENEIACQGPNNDVLLRQHSNRLLL